MSEGVWDRLGVHPETHMPTHLPIALNAAGQGPAEASEAVRLGCWCGHDCPLNQALGESAALAVGHLERDLRATRIRLGDVQLGVERWLASNPIDAAAAATLRTIVLGPRRGAPG